ncbi:hypothetical protein KSP35_20235 [Aquihabitans sp. G128]|uniref:adenylate/guanylate cyclase domain-containing protein n=1 Tax=Aquihabitans sp. G128 TaxID=2849779 RepID=UPI001C212D5E|nr:adenylate/guanylate cyclase domain-containing protein [Aquihabitans sp. G128]QXC60624.1 hypothetical protein KSP35_20235 [Aquihabitans sp. G128]
MAFVDLAGFTAVTEAHGDHHAVELIDLFEETLTRDLPDGGRLLKMIGDAGLLVFDDPAQAVTAILRIVNRTSRDLTFPELRAGLHHGPLTWRRGDPYGATVNIASRVAGQAAGGQVLATAAVAGRLPVEIATSIGHRKLKNVAEELELFELTTVRTPSYRIDPVCKMRLAVGREIAAITMAGTVWYLCSPECASRFLANPVAFMPEV